MINILSTRGDNTGWWYDKIFQTFFICIYCFFYRNRKVKRQRVFRNCS